MWYFLIRSGFLIGDSTLLGLSHSPQLPREWKYRGLQFGARDLRPVLSNPQVIFAVCQGLEGKARRGL